MSEEVIHKDGKMTGPPASRMPAPGHPVQGGDTALAAPAQSPPTKGKPLVSPWDLLKWLVPSLAALCVVVGYVAKFAHHALLGFDPGLLEPNEYIAATGEFFRWLVHLPVSGAATWEHAFLDLPHVLALWPALTLGIGVPVWRRCSRAPEAEDPRRMSQARKWTAAALLLVLLLRLLAMDAPIARLEGALVDAEVWKRGAEPGELVPQQEALGKRLDSDIETSSGLGRAIVTRAQTLWQAKECVRPGLRPATQDKGAHPCTADAYRGVESGEGLAQLLVDCMLLVLAIRVLADDPPAGRASLASIAIVSFLLLAVTFGKLGHSMDYEFALIGLKTPLESDEISAAAPAVPASERLASAGAPRASLAPQSRTWTEMHTRQGVVLHSNKSWTTVAIDETVGCVTTVKIWRIANSEILWERDIFRTDVLTWRAAKTGSDAGCRPAGMFGTGRSSGRGKVQQ